jgi:molecular chaperone DnaK (HSP70)
MIMAKAVGIDLDTTNSVIAVYEGGEPRAVPNAERRTAPGDQGRRPHRRPGGRRGRLVDDPQHVQAGALDESEVQRMIADAGQHQAEDARHRELVEVRNELDGAAYQVERRPRELGDAVPVHEKARAETLTADAYQAVKDDSTPLERIWALAADLQQVFHGLSATAPPSGGGPAKPPGDGGDDVIDAEFRPE